MTREEFEARHESLWIEMENLLLVLEGRRRRRPRLLPSVLKDDRPATARFDFLYRAVCRHLVLARQRLYGTDLVQRLNRLALRAHRQLYGRRRNSGQWALTRFLLHGFPAAVRGRARTVGLAALLFFGPLLGMAAAVVVEPWTVHTVLSPQQVRSVESMYDPASDHFSKERPSDTNLGMFGYYIQNNIGIAFRTFAGGVLFGVGAIFFLVYNGIIIGATLGHLTGIGYGQTFFGFVAGHSALELTAIVLAGAAGLDLGWAVVAPGRLTRVEALKRAARSSVTLVYGVLLMLVLAAFVEGFWSPLVHVPSYLKYGVALLLWAGTIAYFSFAGRNDGS